MNFLLFWVLVRGAYRAALTHQLTHFSLEHVKDVPIRETEKSVGKLGNSLISL